MEPIFVLKKTVEGDYLAPNGKASPSALLRFAMDAASGHTRQMGNDWQTLSKKGMFWAVIRHRLQVERYPEVGEEITVETWPMPTTRSAFPRAATGYDEKGNVVFRLVSLWVLMDINARTMILPGKSDIAVEGILRGDELALPASIAPQELENVTSRQVREEDIDVNVHMNNTRHLVWSLALLPEEMQNRYCPKEMVICYLCEARLDEKIDLHWTLSEEGVLQVDGRREETDVPGKRTRVFAAKLYF